MPDLSDNDSTIADLALDGATILAATTRNQPATSPRSAAATAPPRSLGAASSSTPRPSRWACSRRSPPRAGSWWACC